MTKAKKLADTRDGIARIEVAGTEMLRFVDTVKLVQPGLSYDEQSALHCNYRKDRPGHFHRVHKNTDGIQMGYYYIARMRPQVVDYCTRAENVENAKRSCAIGIGHGAGLKKGKAAALAAAGVPMIKLKLDDVDFEFPANDTTEIQGILDILLMQRSVMQSMLRLTDDEMANLKPRIRVKAGRSEHLSVVPSSVAPTVGGDRRKAGTRGTKRSYTRLDYSGKTPEQIAEMKRERQREYSRRNRAKK